MIATLPFVQFELLRHGVPFFLLKHYHLLRYFCRAKHRRKVPREHLAAPRKNSCMYYYAGPLPKYPLSRKGKERKLGKQQTEQCKLVPLHFVEHGPRFVQAGRGCCQGFVSRVMQRLFCAVTSELGRGDGRSRSLHFTSLCASFPSGRLDCLTLLLNGVGFSLAWLARRQNSDPWVSSVVTKCN